MHMKEELNTETSTLWDAEQDTDDKAPVTSVPETRKVSPLLLTAVTEGYIGYIMIWGNFVFGPHRVHQIMHANPPFWLIN